MDEAPVRPELPEDVEADDVNWSTSKGYGYACSSRNLVLTTGWTWEVRTLSGDRAWVWSRTNGAWYEIGEDV